MEEIACVVVGAGVVGLSIARALALAGREVVVLEAEPKVGTGVSARSSEVVHAGIYYPTGSLRARLCVPGRRALYQYCTARGVAHRRLGKLIVATDEAQHPRLEALLHQARANGVDDLSWIEPTRAAELEPAVRCTAALWSPSTGIVDSHGFMCALRADAEAAGAVFVCGSPAVSGRATAGGFEIEVGGAEPAWLGCRTLVNAAGLGAQAFSRSLAGVAPASIPPLHLARGSYFALSGQRAPFSHLVYPVPEPGGLGVHLTLDLGGQARFGPDVEWIDELGYAVDPDRAFAFYAAIRRYWPELRDGALVPAYAGVRPKITGPGEPAADFAIQGPGEHGVTGYVALYGIESPGLTAALAIADRVLEIIAEAG
jgi:L-2-hydroxyglutarate oxidase LhgO